MTIKVGERLPEAALSQMTPKGPRPVKVSEFFAKKTVLLFAVPGAFTPTCSERHLPGYMDHAEAILAKGADVIACLSVNDAFVMGAWAKERGAAESIAMLADGNGDFTKALGLEMDASSFGMGTRSRRYAMIVEDGVVKHLEEEPNPAQATVSGAEHMLGLLD